MTQEDVFELVVTAMKEHKGITITHQKDRDEEPTTRDVLPFWVTEGNLGEYVHGYCRLRNARRSFRLDRIKNVVVRDTEVPTEGYIFIGQRHNLFINPIGATHGIVHCGAGMCRFCKSHGDCSAEGQM
jgi:predicted DNA-binding transcriptional regulator YafY